MMPRRTALSLPLLTVLITASNPAADSFRMPDGQRVAVFSGRTHGRRSRPLICSAVSKRRKIAFFARKSSRGDSDDEIADEHGEDLDDLTPVELPDESELPLDQDELKLLTIPQLKQQLRLRGLKVSGRKEELIERLLRYTGAAIPMFKEDEEEEEVWSSATTTAESSGGSSSKARQFAKEKGKELVDVADFLDVEDKGKEVKSAAIGSGSSGVVDNEEDDGDVSEETRSGAEVWGAEARIVDDYEGRRIVVDSLSQTVVEFVGSNQTTVQAYCAATRDALKPFLAGGSNVTAAATSGSGKKRKTPAEQRLEQIQLQREQAARRPVHMEDQVGLDEGDETGIYKDILHRDFSDWGKYTQTGAQLSASEVQGVLLLSDVYGAFTDDTRALADKIAYECQPVVVVVPDLFRGDPWSGPTDGLNDKGQTYEKWREQHSDLRVSVDIRAAAACLRERYGVSSVVVWGTCYGGGRALEAASGWLPGGNVHDVDGSIGPPTVNPMACIAWYPTRYNAEELFGKQNKGTREDLEGRGRQMAVMAVFAGDDRIPGATKEDAATLKSLLEEDDRVKDHMVKAFPGQDHGFAHRGISEHQDQQDDPFERFVDDEFGGAGRVSIGSGGDAEVACLLSTAFMETYSRVFLPTVGPPISRDLEEEDWGKKIEMKDLSGANNRDVRQEIEESLDQFVEEPLGGYRIDPSDKSQEEELKRLLKSMQDSSYDGPYAIEDDDDLSTIYGKLTASDEDFQLF